MADVSVSVLSNKQCHLGEGPSFDARDGTLYWFDILGKKLHGLHAESGHETEVALPKMGTAIFSVDADRQLILMEDGFHVRFRQSGVMALAIPVEADNAATRSNDARAHPCGAIWFGTMGRRAEKGAGSIYHVHKGKVTRLYPGITIPNSICFSPDGATAYFTDTDLGKLMRVDIDPHTALPVGEPKVFYDHSGGEGGLDGSVVDADGILWNARWGAALVDAYSPDGKRIRSTAMPANQPSCPAFYGKALDQLAITSAFEGYSEADRAADPECGKTFLIDLPVKGRPEPEVFLA